MARFSNDADLAIRLSWRYHIMTLYTLLYDGKCRICTWQVDIIARADRAGYLTFADINTTNIHAQFPHIMPHETQQALHLIGPRGLLRGADAVRHILLLLPGWCVLGALMYLPGVMSLAHPVYRWVARNRYRLGGRILCPNDTCRISDALPETFGG